LWVDGANRGVPMAGGTSPALAFSHNYGPFAAVQGPNGSLWVWNLLGGSDWGRSMTAGTSPAITELPSTAVDIALSGDSGTIWTTGYGNTGRRPAAGTRPAIAAPAYRPPADPPPTSYPNGRLPDSALETVEGGCRVAKQAAGSLRQLLAEARAAGLSIAPSGAANCYRSYEEQEEARRNACNQGNCATAAAPGTSKHGYGVAVDLSPLFFDNANYRWLKDNAGRFGWYHPDWAEPGGVTPEPWHWEFAL
jgi:hypothetical protein